MAQESIDKPQQFEWTSNIEMAKKICCFLFPKKQVEKKELDDYISIIVCVRREILQIDCPKQKNEVLHVYIGNPQRKNPRIQAILNGCRELELRPRQGKFQRRAIIRADGYNKTKGGLPLILIDENLEFHVTI